MTPKSRDWYRPYLGGAYLWRGRTPQLNRRPSGPGEMLGVDCWGLHAHVMREVFGRPVNDYGAAYPDDGDAGRDQARAKIAAEMSGWSEVPWEEGAGALFRVDGEPVHIGTCLSRFGYVLHAHHEVGVDTLHFTKSIRWGKRFVGCYLPR